MMEEAWGFMGSQRGFSAQYWGEEKGGGHSRHVTRFCSDHSTNQLCEASDQPRGVTETGVAMLTESRGEKRSVTGSRGMSGKAPWRRRLC